MMQAKSSVTPVEWPGYVTYIGRNIDKDKTIIILRNHETPGESLKKTRQILYGLKEEVKKEMTVAADVLKQFAGAWQAELAKAYRNEKGRTKCGTVAFGLSLPLQGSPKAIPLSPPASLN